MNLSDREQAIARARESYRRWAQRPWYVKAWDRVRSELGYIAFRVKGD